MFVEVNADPGAHRCCWCDCTVEQHLQFGDCDGCHNDADFVVHTMPGALDQNAYPLCRHHHPDFVRSLKKWVFPGVPLDIVSYDVYDQD